MKLVHHLARFVPGDPGVLALGEDAVLAALEAFGLVARLQQSWRPRDGVVPPVKPKLLRGTVWASENELATYLQMALEEGRARGHTWRERVPSIAARIPPAGRELVLFVLSACAFDPVSETLDQGYLVDAFAAALAEDREACLNEVREHYRAHFDYHRALRWMLDADTATVAAAGQGAVTELLDRLGMSLPGARELDAEELARLPESTLLAMFDDASQSATLYLVPSPLVTSELRRAVGPTRSLCFAGPEDLSEASWFAAVRVISAVGEEITPLYDEYLGPFAGQPGCPSPDELSALQGTWSQYCCVTFEDGTTAEGRRARRGGLNARIRDLLLVNRAM